jgi:mannose-6-phosphate isomerase-like protein (cupin superfamily)
MESYNLLDLEIEHHAKGDLYYQFMSKDKLSVGIYRLDAGSTDPQSPHLEDEVYYVLKGRAKIRVGTELKDVEPSEIIFVAAGEDHKFLDIEEDLELLVFFAPAHSPS